MTVSFSFDITIVKLKIKLEESIFILILKLPDNSKSKEHIPLCTSEEVITKGHHLNCTHYHLKLGSKKVTHI